MTAREEFYDHKRQAHNGAFDSRCALCQELWAALVAASKAKASGHG